MRTLHFADLRRAPRGAVEPGEVADHLAAMVHAAITTNRVRHLAVIELFLEATRRPELHAAMSALRSSQIQLMRDIHRAAGLELAPADAALLVTAITGIVHFALTTPEAIDLRSPDEVAATRAPRRRPHPHPRGAARRLRNHHDRRSGPSCTKYCRSGHVRRSSSTTSPAGLTKPALSAVHSIS